MQTSPHDHRGTLAAPLAYEAFLALHRPHYLAYARARLGPTGADAAVTGAFAALLCRWPGVISSCSPAAQAWQILSRRVRAHAGEPPGRTAEDVLAEDVRVLMSLGYDAEHSAGLTGVPVGTVHSLLRRP
ncbi:hypothetical protein [Streptomyces sp. NPDC015131]|uniref:hypothetical protein n=1 Tax=Streptomyces sp. NPDC015131 TaxID=3364941 RepID=UPI0036FCB55D